MKLRYIIVLFALSVGTLVGIVKYYNLDPALLASLSFYEDLANPSITIVRVPEGLRKEQIADIMSAKLGWNETAKDAFINIHLALNSRDLEGHYFPKTYLIPKDEDPIGMTSKMFHEYSVETSTIKKPKSKNVINSDTALTVASIIQREAGSKSDMKLIAGILWNRIFSGMKLQVDATLQYAKGSAEDGWWGKVNPEDKKIDSSYNTYQHAGLPPSAISNPGLAAIDAAYNPQTTACLFYLHDKNRNIHCATTYAQHLKNIAMYY
jgi:UPF0755 protein